MAYGCLVLKSSDIPSDWKCVICLESDQEDLIVAHVRYIRKKGEGNPKAYSNGGEKHPIHYKCMQEAFENDRFQCPSCREKLFEREALSERVVTHADGTEDAVREVAMCFFDYDNSLKELPPFKE